MRLSRSGITIGVMAVMIAVLFGALVYFARDELSIVDEHEEEAIPTASAVSQQDGATVITASTQTQRASGIATRELAGANSQAYAEVHGTVLDPAPLFAQRGDYLAALAQVRAQRIAVASSENEYQRAKRLFADDRNVSERSLQSAQTQWRSDQARLEAAQQGARALSDALRALWGDNLAQSAAEPEAALFQRLSAGREVLLQLSVPYEWREQVAKRPVEVGAAGSPESLRPARYLAPAQRADAGVTGSTHLFIADARDLRQGMRIAGRLELDATTRGGVLIPHDAVVWHGGKAWCYIQDSDQTFVRREVSAVEEATGGWFNADGFKAGERVVVRGAQLLLSEEYKFQIREENDD
ncbi:MAG: hypothetical protein FJY37_05225 [Betaproteobacteria bacterium]|nr:hypothetical protein [Betaproteobacteria bacterium]